MPVLNFGKSEYVLYSSIQSTLDEPDMVIDIPEGGGLRQFESERAIEKADLTTLTPFKSNHSLTAIRFPVVGDEYDLERKVIMPWIPERGEWVAITYHKRVECGAKNDECYSGPFQLDEYCEKRILEAYHIPEASMRSVDDVRKLSPEQLKQIAERSQGVLFSLGYSVEGDADSYAVDWFSREHRWAGSCRDSGLGHAWMTGLDLDKHAYRTLVESFGLGEIPLEQISKTGPRELTKLGKYNPVSSTVGDGRKASEVV